MVSDPSSDPVVGWDAALAPFSPRGSPPAHRDAGPLGHGRLRLSEATASRLPDGCGREAVESGETLGVDHNEGLLLRSNPLPSQGGFGGPTGREGQHPRSGDLRGLLGPGNLS